MGKLGVLLAFVLVLCSCTDTDPHTTAAGPDAAEGSLLAPVLPYLDTVLAASGGITLGSNQFAICYHRPDAAYGPWNLWLWSALRGGARYPFTGISNEVAVYIGDKTNFFNAGCRTLGLIVRTDAWAKDPGADQFVNIDNGDRFVVFSGMEPVYPVQPLQPVFLSAALHEEPVNTIHIRLRLSHRYGLPLAVSNSGFSITGGLVVTDARNFVYRNSTDRNRNCSDDVLLKITGPLNNSNTYLISHPSFGNSIPLRFSALPSQTPELPDADKALLPEPVLEEHPRWVALYWAAWKFMREKITTGSTLNGFEPSYIDEGFNENIYQWDSCFMVAYAIYGLDVFPAMATLDNFYNHQRAADGYICRCYNETTGLATGENDINPPLFAWMEWRYYRLTGDTSRLARVLPVLDSYFGWVKNNARGPSGGGLYWITDLGSGMDNSPRESYIRKGAWIDLSSQQALAALYLSRLAAVAGDTGLATKYQTEFNELKSLINGQLWNGTHGMYYDKKEDGSWHVQNTIASFWPLVAEVAETAEAALLINNHLKNPAEFYRAHLFPTLAASDPLYDPAGHYWRGAVWAPTDFAVIKGIALHDRAFAHEAAVNHVDNMSSVYHDFVPSAYQFRMPGLDEPNIPRNGDGIGQIWEAYAPDAAAPATRWDAQLLVRQKFCGWSGVGPVALLLENILGFDVNGAENTITWDIRLTEKHGVRRIKLGTTTVTLVAEPRAGAGAPVVINGTTTAPFRLVVCDNGTQVHDQTVSGTISLTINP